MENFDDAILDNIRLEDINNYPKKATNDQAQNSSKPNYSRHKNISSGKFHHKSNESSSIKHSSKRTKRLPWNTEILRDRFTPQPFQVQLIDNYLKNLLSESNDKFYESSNKNTIIFMRNKDCKNYFKIMTIREYLVKLNELEMITGDKKLMILITNMGSDVSKYVELISRHTTIKIAGIDLNLMSNADPKIKTDDRCMQLKNEAEILIMSVNILAEWLKKCYLTVEEISLIIFEEVCAAFHNDSYKLVMNSYFKNSTKLPNILGFGTLDITRSTNPTHVKQHIDFLKDLFKCDLVETATDLLDTQNLFHGYEPKEFVLICDSADLLNKFQSNLAKSSTEFQIKLVDKIKHGYLFLEDLNNSTVDLYPNNDSLSYIHLLCVRVLNECVYLLNEVGIWCLAKSLLPFICQLDKLSTYIENTDKKQQHYNQNLSENSNESETEKEDNIILLDNPTTQQILILKFTSTLLRELREMCIKQFLNSRFHSSNNLSSFDYFLINFTTPKVRSLINLLRNTNNTFTDEFCSLIFVQNKQVATSLSLLLKKLAKEDSFLNYLYPNYIIGPASLSNNTNSNIGKSNYKIDNETTNQNANSHPGSNDCFKQEEILRKFYSGEINLLICTYEMEERIQSPNCVNLIVRFNCSVNTNDANINSTPTSNGNQTQSNDYLPFDYFSYISTKTRAKTKNSHCYFFIEKSQFDSFFCQFSKFKQIENILIKNYSKLIQLNKPIKEFSLKDIRSNLNLENSIYFINKYCIRLPSDALTQLTPKIEIKIRKINDNLEYKCFLYLPINSGVRDSIESEWEPTLDLAKTTASYKACLILLSYNEINEMLEPITKEMFYRQKHKSDSDDEREWSQFNSYFEKHQKQHYGQLYQNFDNFNQQIANYMSHRPGGNKRKQIYRKKISPYMKSLQLVTIQHPSYVYAIKCSLTTPLINTNDSKNNFTIKNNWCFGLITSKLLLEIVDFPIFTQNGEETVSLELIKSSIYLTPNQLRSVKIFHKFLFSNVLRMEGRGAMASPILLNSTNASKSTDQTGIYVCILVEKTKEFDWDLMSSIEGCTDRTFMRIPNYAKKIVEEDEENQNLNNDQENYQFIESKYADSVVIPFYRNSDIQPQFYCVSAIDYSLNPLSPFPVSSHSKASSFETFFQYFAYKYNILITNLNQPLLIVTHPSTRLNLLTPRYMNMKASVLQKSYHQSIKSDKKSSSNQIFLIPELVNIHPLSATVWRRSLCLPSILYRLNSLLVAEELRREIAKSTGVGVPWISENQKFENLSFMWDANKEIEVSNIPDQEIDITTIENEKKSTINEADQVDPKWNFEISEWDDSCIKEASKSTTKKSNFGNNLFTMDFMNKDSFGCGWNDENPSSNYKTLFIDPNDMNFFGDDIIESDLDDDYYDDNNYMKDSKKPDTNIFQDNHHDTNSLNDDSEKDDDYDDYEEQKNEDATDKQDDIQIKFTIDLNTLKADMKKKSAKLLSKLSVSSNNCNLVKSLVKNLNEPIYDGINYNPINNKTDLTKNDYDLSFHEDFSLANLSNDLNSIKNENFGFNLSLQKLTPNYLLDLNDSDLKDWFQHIEFVFDFNNTDANDFLSSSIENLKNKLEKNSKELKQLENISKTCCLNETSIFRKLSLPLNREEADKILLKIPKSEIVKEKKVKLKQKKTANSSGISQSLRNTDWSFHFSLDDTYQNNTLSELGPGPAVLLQALTLSNAGDGFDLERLETVGDSFLKQAITVYLFFTYPNVHEGKLSFLRSKQVSNYNLYKLGKRKGLQELIVSTKFEPLDSWLPPLYESVVNTNDTNFFSTIFSKFNTSKTTKNATNNEKQQNQKFDKYKDHILSDKSIADSVESIIGAYLIASGPHAALQVMSWFGLQVLPKAKCEDGSEVLINLPQVPPPKINDKDKLEELLNGYESFEACIGYKFKQPAYLLQAFTHSSYTFNTVTDCYQRLEFLGDAILDYVITRHLYEDKKRHSPGELTDLRSALVNNNIFAYLAVKYEFYKYFKYSSPILFTIIDNFVQNQKKRNDEFDLEEDFFDYPIDDDEDEYYLLMNNTDNINLNDGKSSSNEMDTHENTYQPFFNMQTNELEELEVPKCLGDIFESVAGAIFLDSNKSFDTVWRVYYGLMKPHIDKFTNEVPKSPIRELLELEPETAKFEKPERTIDGKIRVTVSVFGRGKFKGVGRNYRIAKNAAAKLALKFLKNQNCSNE